MPFNRLLQANEVEGIRSDRNYIANSNAERNPIGWVAYADAAGFLPTDGTGGTPNLVFSRTLITPLRGIASFNLNKPSISVNGNGVSCDFTIDAADRASVLNISFDYLASGSFLYNAGTAASPSHLVVYIYDITNAVLIHPSQSFLDGSGKFLANFQTNSNSTSYRLILHVTDAGAFSAWDLKFDNVIVGPSNVARGAVMSDWISFTPTGTWVTNTTYTGNYRRLGDSIYINYNLALAGAPTAASLRVNLPLGLTIDTAKLPGFIANTLPALGKGLAYDVSADVDHILTAYYISTTSIGLGYQSSVTATQALVNATSPQTWATGDSVTVTVGPIPIVGWSSNTLISSDYGSRVISTRVSTISGSVSNVGDTTITMATVAFDRTGSWNGTNTFTVPESGLYDIDATIGFAAAFTGICTLKYKINSASSVVMSAISNPTQFETIVGIVKLQLNAGDTIQMVSAQSSAASVTLDGASFALTKIQSPQTLAGGAVVAFQGRNTAATVITASFVSIPFTAIRDTHGRWATNQFTVQESGFYAMAWGLYTESVTLSTSQSFVSAVFVDGVEFILGYDSFGNGISKPHSTSGSSSAHYLNAGQIVTLRALASLNVALQTGAARNYFTIAKV